MTPDAPMTPQDALVALMITVSASDEDIRTAELVKINNLINHLPLFADYDDLFDAVAQTWFMPQMAVMEEVLSSNLPPQRKMYEFFRRRFVISRERFRADPEHFTILCEMGAANFERVRSYVDLADHYLCELIAEAQAEGFFAGLEIDEALSLINQMVSPYTLPDALIYLGPKLTEQKLARIVDTMFIGLSGEAGTDASGVNTLKVAS